MIKKIMITLLLLAALPALGAANDTQKAFIYAAARAIFPEPASPSSSPSKVSFDAKKRTPPMDICIQRGRTPSPVGGAGALYKGNSVNLGAMGEYDTAAKGVLDRRAEKAAGLAMVRLATVSLGGESSDDEQYHVVGAGLGKGVIQASLKAAGVAQTLVNTDPLVPSTDEEEDEDMFFFLDDEPAGSDEGTVTASQPRVSSKPAHVVRASSDYEISYGPTVPDRSSVPVSRVVDEDEDQE